MSNTTNYADAGPGVAFLALSLIFLILISIAISVLTIICNWKIYKKAGKKGWESIIPIYNIVVFFEIVDLPIWYIIFEFIPFANIYLKFKMNIELARKFGKGEGFGLGLVFLSLVFLILLAFDNKVVYQGVETLNTVSKETKSTESEVNKTEDIEVKIVGNKFCTNCGKPVLKTSRFCGNCGTQIK